MSKDLKRRSSSIFPISWYSVTLNHTYLRMFLYFGDWKHRTTKGWYNFPFLNLIGIWRIWSSIQSVKLKLTNFQIKLTTVYEKKQIRIIIGIPNYVREFNYALRLPTWLSSAGSRIRFRHVYKFRTHLKHTKNGIVSNCIGATNSCWTTMRDKTGCYHPTIS